MKHIVRPCSAAAPFQTPHYYLLIAVRQPFLVFLISHCPWILIAVDILIANATLSSFPLSTPLVEQY
jgi:hypothetical protein